MGSTLNPDDIKEGDDVYFECQIKSNPKEHRITWWHDVSVENKIFMQSEENKNRWNGELNKKCCFIIHLRNDQLVTQRRKWWNFIFIFYACLST